MKSAQVKAQTPSLQSFIKRSASTRKDRRSQSSVNDVKPPTEEIINELNNLGKQYPFCINFKQKRHDPL
ncbi:hypothetical protein [Niastella sp. OAS944]|uniref:hypothetical protein n=1 Tax=Niastella sp. OAS944 TaxID=2664089 RepID=UPI0034766A29|nr:hypothetical protein [Chitinophagaceae bacterium OAS944]